MTVTSNVSVDDIDNLLETLQCAPSLLEERPTLSMMLSDLPEVRSLDALLYDAVLTSGGAFT